MVLAALAAAFPMTRASAQVRYEPSSTRAIVAPLAVQDAPLNSRVTLVLVAQKDLVQSEWPAELPATAAAGWTAVALTTEDGTRVPASIRVSESRAGVRVDLVPTADLAPETAYTVRVAAAVRLPNAPPDQPIPVTQRIETRFKTATARDDRAPGWSSFGQASLRTRLSGPGRGSCQKYREELTFDVGEISDDATAMSAMRIFVAPVVEGGEPAPSETLMLTGSNLGSFTVSSCDGAMSPWGATEPGTKHRIMQVWAEDLGGHRTEPKVVAFQRPTAQTEDWTTPGRVLAAGEELPSGEPADNAQAEPTTQADAQANDAGAAPSTPIVVGGVLAALVLIGGLIAFARRRRS